MAGCKVGMDIEGAEFVEHVSGPIAQRDEAGPGQAVWFHDRQTSEGVSELLHSVPRDRDSSLVFSQALELFQMCERGELHQPLFKGDYTPVIEGSAETDGAALMPVVGPDHVEGDVLLSSNTTTVLSRIAQSPSNGVVHKGLGPRSQVADDGDKAITESSKGATADFAIDTSKCVTGKCPRSIEELEICLWREFGVRAKDIAPDKFDAFLLKQSSAPCISPTERRRTAESKSSPSERSPDLHKVDQRVDVRKLNGIVSEAVSRLGSREEPSGQSEILQKYVSAGLRIAQASLSSASEWTGATIRAIHNNGAAAEFQHEQSDVATVMEESMNIVATHQAEDAAGDQFSTESIAPAIDDIYLAKSNQPQLAPANRMALSACSALVDQLGFALDEEDVLRCSNAALLDLVSDDALYEAQVDTHKRRFLDQGKSEVDSDVIARDICSRALIKSSPDRLVVLCAFQLLEAMVASTTKTGRLSIKKLHPAHSRTFSTSSPFSAEPPSVVCYTANVARALATFGDVHVKWTQTALQVSERLAILCKSRKVNRSSVLPKLRGLKITAVPDNLVSVVPDKVAEKPPESPAPDSGVPRASMYPTVLRPVCDRRTCIPRSPVEVSFNADVKNNVRYVNAIADADPKSESTSADPVHVPSVMKSLLQGEDDVSHMQHVVAPVCNVFMTRDPLPPWAASMLRRDKYLARLVENVRRDSLPAYSAPSPLSKTSVSRLGSVVDFFTAAMEASPAALDMIKVLARQLLPLEAPELGHRSRAAIRSAQRLHEAEWKAGENAEPLLGDLEEEYEFAEGLNDDL